MSDPTYRIDVEHKPTAGMWTAWITRLSDEYAVEVVSGATADEALQNAQTWVVAQSTKQTGYSVYVDDDGQPVEAHSVKA